MSSAHTLSNNFSGVLRPPDIFFYVISIYSKSLREGEGLDQPHPPTFPWTHPPPPICHTLKQWPAPSTHTCRPTPRFLPLQFIRLPGALQYMYRIFILVQEGRLTVLQQNVMRQSWARKVLGPYQNKGAEMQIN